MCGWVWVGGWVGVRVGGCCDILAVGLDHALQCLSREDPSLRVRTDKDSGQVKGDRLLVMDCCCHSLH